MANGLSEKEIRSLYITKRKGGFSLWVTEETEINGVKCTHNHWLLDGSLLKEDLQIRLGNSSGTWGIVATYNKKQHAINIKKSKIKL